MVTTYYGDNYGARLFQTDGDIELVEQCAGLEYCMDNAAMIAALGYHQHRRGDLATLDLEARAD